MDLNIYNTSNEEAILKSIGPFRIVASDDSFSGVIEPYSITVQTPIIVGDVEQFGQNSH